MLLIRVGEFYEALGYDAVMLVMHAGLNPMGGAGAVPRAGCPLLKVQETLDRLTSKGIRVRRLRRGSVMNPLGQRAPPKERYVAAIVTPASPQYVVGAADAGDDVAFDGDAPPPVVGVASGAVGYTVVSVESRICAGRRPRGTHRGECGCAVSLRGYRSAAVSSREPGRRFRGARGGVRGHRRADPAPSNGVGNIVAPRRGGDEKV